MKTTLCIAADSVRALLHQRLLLGLMLATLALIIFFSVTLSKAREGISESYSDDSTNKTSLTVTNGMSETEQRHFRESMENASSQIQAMFYEVALFAGNLVSLFIFSTAVTGEIRRGTIRLTLSKPVSRLQFLLGKYLGGVLVMMAYACLVTAAIWFFAGAQSVDLNPAVKWAPWLMFCEQLMLGSVAMLLSLFMPPIVAAVLTFFSGNAFYSTSNPLYYILPGYHNFIPPFRQE